MAQGAEPYGESHDLGTSTGLEPAPSPYDPAFFSLSLQSVSLDVADPDQGVGSPSVAVENCECPWGYSGTSCEVRLVSCLLLHYLLHVSFLFTFFLSTRCLLPVYLTPVYIYTFCLLPFDFQFTSFKVRLAVSPLPVM